MHYVLLRLALYTYSTIKFKLLMTAFYIHHLTCTEFIYRYPDAQRYQLVYIHVLVCIISTHYCIVAYTLSICVSDNHCLQLVLSALNVYLLAMCYTLAMLCTSSNSCAISWVNSNSLHYCCPISYRPVSICINSI